MAGPQYTGWPDFEPSVREAFDLLLQSFPSYQKLLRLKQVVIRYINAFTTLHGLENYAQFTSRYLGLKSVMPQPFLQSLGVQLGDVSTTSQSKFPIRGLAASHLSIQAAEGAVNGAPACILQLAVEGGNVIKPEHADLMAWFNGAHDVARQAFTSLVTPELIQVMQPEEKP